MPVLQKGIRDCVPGQVKHCPRDVRSTKEWDATPQLSVALHPPCALTVVQMAGVALLVSGRMVREAQLCCNLSVSLAGQMQWLIRGSWPYGIRSLHCILSLLALRSSVLMYGECRGLLEMAGVKCLLWLFSGVERCFQGEGQDTSSQNY